MCRAIVFSAAWFADSPVRCCGWVQVKFRWMISGRLSRAGIVPGPTFRCRHRACFWNGYIIHFQWVEVFADWYNAGETKKAASNRKGFDVHNHVQLVPPWVLSGKKVSSASDALMQESFSLERLYCIGLSLIVGIYIRKLNHEQGGPSYPHLLKKTLPVIISPLSLHSAFEKRHSSYSKWWPDSEKFSSNFWK